MDIDTLIVYSRKQPPEMFTRKKCMMSNSRLRPPDEPIERAYVKCLAISENTFRLIARSSQQSSVSFSFVWCRLSHPISRQSTPSSYVYTIYYEHAYIHNHHTHTIRTYLFKYYILIYRWV